MHDVAERPASRASVSPSSLAPPSIWRRIRRDVLLLGAGNVAIVCAQLGFRSLLIGALAPTAYGRLSLVLAVYNVVWIVGASGLPNAAARHIARIAPGDDSAIIRSALKASVLPTILAGSLVAGLSSVLLSSAVAIPLAAVGLSSLVYSLLMMGILRGRACVGAAACVMPIAASGEVVPLALLRLLGVSVTPLSGFAVFCLGNAVGLIAGVLLVIRTKPSHRTASAPPAHEVPSARQLLGFSVWLGLATLGLAMLPLVLRASAAIDSYTTVAVIDVALVLFAFPQRLGAIIVMAVTPHASRALDREEWSVAISRRENLLTVVPFLIGAAIVAFTPIIGWLFGLLGRPVYARSADFLALALLAGPARVLYGVVEGALIAHGEGRAMALNVLAVATTAVALICAAAALGSSTIAFVVFVLAYWAIYLLGLARVNRHKAYS